MLFDQRDPLFRLSLWYIIPSAVLITGFFVFVVGKGVRSQLVPAKPGMQTMLGKEANALTQIDSESGKVFYEGAYWNKEARRQLVRERPSASSHRWLHYGRTEILRNNSMIEDVTKLLAS